MEGGSASRAQGFLQGPHPIRTPALAVTSFRPLRHEKPDNSSLGFHGPAPKWSVPLGDCPREMTVAGIPRNQSLHWSTSYGASRLWHRGCIG